MSKNKFYKILLVNLILIFILGGAIFTIDPYQRYRKPFYNKTVSINQIAVNPGLLKNYKYDSLILGSSMAQNFISEEANINLNGKFINVSIGGAQAKDLQIILRTAQENKNLKKILISLDIWGFEGNVPNGPRSYKHLYDQNYLKDYKYLLNIQSWLDVLKILVKEKKNPYDLTFDGGNYIYKKENVLRDYEESKKLKNNKILNIEKIKNTIENTWVKEIKENQNTEFIFYFPPYSILTYKMWGNTFFDYMNIKKTLIENMVSYSNVKIYDFQNIKEITHELDYYKDFSHYHPKINSWMLSEMKNNSNRVTLNNYKDKIKELIDQVKIYDI